MQLACPQCGTREVRVSQSRGFDEVCKSLVGIYQLRCRRCHARWQTSVWADGAWRYARCPRCYRQELTTWSEQYYRPPAWTTILLRIGATPYRCAPCRCNFASFRPCKERYSWRKRKVEASESTLGAREETSAESAANSASSQPVTAQADASVSECSPE